MKRALEADFDETSQFVIKEYVRPLLLAQHFYAHVCRLYDREAMYSTGNTYFELQFPAESKKPAISFDWINEGKDRDEWVIQPDNEDADLMFFFGVALATPFNKMKPETKRTNYKFLADYFMRQPALDLVIDNWGEDSPILGGKIGVSTGYLWVENEPESGHDWEGDEDDEDE